MDTALAQELSKFDGLLKFKKTEQLNVFLQLYHKVIAFFSGNRGGKTSTVAVGYWLRVLGLHPLAEKNRLCRKIRCMSSSLPETEDPEQEDNAQYIELKKIIPKEFIISDITARKKTLVVKSPNPLNKKGQTVFEFRSSKQELQDLGKISLSSVWHDEETPQVIREECKMRLGEEKGDEIFTLTPINYLSYCHDSIWDVASFIYRTKIIADKFNLPQVEHKRGGDKNIACIQMATDDNPMLDEESLSIMFDGIVDPDELAIRRYGVFKAISGRVHKAYDPSACYLSYDKYFPGGVPENWLHCRGIDYHESRLPWSIGWMSCSPEDEWFLWKEFHPAIDGPNAYTTHEICKAMARKSLDYQYDVNLIDPLAAKKQANTGFSVIDDMNRHFDSLRQQEGLGKPTYWQSWDTKGTGGRDEVAMRFKNAVRCGVPFNNLEKKKTGRLVYSDKLKRLVPRSGLQTHLPTLWIMDTCPKFHNSIMKWRFGEWATMTSKAVHDANTKPQEKFSHDCMVLECLAKDSRVVHAARLMRNRPPTQHYVPKSVTGR